MNEQKINTHPQRYMIAQGRKYIHSHNHHMPKDTPHNLIKNMNESSTCLNVKEIKESTDVIANEKGGILNPTFIL